VALQGAESPDELNGGLVVIAFPSGIGADAKAPSACDQIGRVGFNSRDPVLKRSDWF
jgi:hypothetical protein